MNNIKFIHSAFCGSCLVDCTVLYMNAELEIYEIEFIDPFTKELAIRSVKKDQLIFPRFQDYFVP